MPLDDISEDRFRQNLLNLQIVNGALAAGLVVFLVVVLVLRGTPDQAAQPDLLTYVSVGFFGVILVASYVVPRAITRGQIAQIASGMWKPPANNPSNVDFSAESMQIITIYHIQSIVRWAMLEGAGFFGLMAYQMEGHWLALGVAIVALALLLFLFPTRSQVENWVERHHQQIQGLRQWQQPN